MIMHRDLKPCNLLLDEDNNLKIADFGLSKKASFSARRKSNTIVSLWYRSPEIVLGEEEYLTGVDLWSIGCIIYDLLALNPLFKATDDFELLEKVFAMLGEPTKDHAPSIYALPIFKKMM
jgi:serine/threonine protein kinase